MYLPLWTSGLTPEVVKIAEMELGETPEVRAECLKELKSLLKEIPDFNPRLDEGFLLRFLRTKKFDVKKALTTMRNYYYFKARYTGILTDFTPTQVSKCLQQKECCLTALHYRTPENVAIGVIRPGFFDFDEVTANMIFACCLVCTDILLENEPTQVCGYGIIFDFIKMTPKVFKEFASPTFIYRLVKLIQDCIPCRVKGLYLVNEPFYFNILFSMAKPFLSEKISKRVHFFGQDMKSLHKHLPPDILPEEYGGTMGPVNNKEMAPKVLCRDEHFMHVNQYGFHGTTVQNVKRKDSKTLFD